MLVGKVAVPKTGQKSALPRDNLYPMGPVHEATGGHAIQTYPAAAARSFLRDTKKAGECLQTHTKLQTLSCFIC